VREVGSAGSYLSASPLRLHVGLGEHARADRLTIQWPSGKRQVLEQVPGNRVMTVDEADAR
jgi:enediyne biosynthesis protein E4